jgi:mRNA interferase MazF
MKSIQKGMVIDINLDPVFGSETGKIRPCIVITNDIYNKKVPVIQVIPITEWSEKKECILTNIVIEPDDNNGLTKKSIADCLQTRAIDYKHRIKNIRGKISNEIIMEIEQALMFVFGITSLD